jgi:hypothetical protein
MTNSLSAGSSELTVPPLEPVLVVLVVPDVSVPLVSTVDVVAEVSVPLVVVVDVSVASLLLVSLWQANAITANAQKSARIQGYVFIFLIVKIAPFVSRYGSADVHKVLQPGGERYRRPTSSSNRCAFNATIGIVNNRDGHQRPPVV